VSWGSPLYYVLDATVMVAALGVMVQGFWTLVTRRVPQLVVRIRGEAIARQPLRVGGSQVLLGTAVLMIETSDLSIPDKLDTVMSVAAGAALAAALVWYAAQRS
jgi:hypothetical protein